MKSETVREYLLHTEVNTLCVIRMAGYISAVTFIDHEDLSTCAIPEIFLEKYVDEVSRGTLRITPNKVEMMIPVTYIDAKSKY